MKQLRGVSARTLAICGLPLLLAGCSVGLYGSTRKAYRRYSSAVPAVERVAAPFRAAHVSLLPDDPVLADYLGLALERNPAVATARREAEAAGYRIAQVTSLEDPMLTFVPPTGDLAETAAGRVDSAVGLSQKIPFPGKLRARGKKASHEAAAAFENYRSTVLQTISEVRRAYYMIYFADRSIEITENSRDLLKDFRDIAARKYEAGSVPQQDLLRAQVELANLENELITLHRVRDTAQARLNRLMSLPVNNLLPKTPRIEGREVALALDDLLRTAEQDNPEIAAARERVARAEASLTLAKLDYAPDFTVGYTFTSVAGTGLSPVRNGDNSTQLGVGINLPIWFERLTAERKEAVARLRASKEGLVDVRDTTAFRIEEAMLEVDTQQRLVELFDGVIIPEAKQTLDATVSAYRAAQVDFLTLVENWRRLLDFKVAYQKSLSGFEQALAELERVVGRPVTTGGKHPKNS